MIWKKRSRIRAVQIENSRGLLGIRMDKFMNALIRELCRVTKELMRCSLLVQPCGENGEWWHC